MFVIIKRKDYKNVVWWIIQNLYRCWHSEDDWCISLKIENDLNVFQRQEN